MQARRYRHEMLGFTLIELIIAITVVGILSGVALVGIAGLTENASTHACAMSADAATTASAAYYARTNSYATRWTDMTASTPPVFELHHDVTVNAANPKELDGKGWTLTIAGGGVTRPTFGCANVAR